MSSILVLLGSAKDKPHLERGMPYFERFGVEFDLEVSSAHRQPENTTRLASEAREKGYKAIICVAGMAAHLGGVVARTRQRVLLFVASRLTADRSMNAAMVDRFHP